MSGDLGINFKSESYSTTSLSNTNGQNDTAEELAKNLDKMKSYIAELKTQLSGYNQQDSFQGSNDLNNSDLGRF